MPQYGEWITEKSHYEGGQGWTYLAHRAGSPGKIYVLKVLKNPRRRERFEREIAALERLSHPGIVRIVDHGLDDKRPWLVAAGLAPPSDGKIS